MAGPERPEEPGTSSAGLSSEEIRRYSRQVVLPEVGLGGQRRLKRGSVLVIGAGGLGSPAALYLAAAGVGRLGVIDPDAVDVTNLHRQILHGVGSIGASKVASARARLLDLNPEVRIDAYDEALTSENAIRIARPYDIVLDASDNLATRYLSNDLCVLLGKPNVYGAVSRFEGQVSVFDARSGPCYRCLFPTPPPAGLVRSSAETGILGVLPGIVGTLQATEALKLLLGIGTPLTGILLVYDALDQTLTCLPVAKSPRCPACGEEPTIAGLVDYDALSGPRSIDAPTEDAP